MKKKATAKQWSNVAGIYGTTVLFATATYFAAVAHETHPRWWYDALRGLVVASCVLIFITGFKGRGWWFLLSAVAAGLAGVYVFSHLRKDEWAPINKVTSIFFGFNAIFALMLALATTYAIAKYGDMSSEPDDDHFPNRPMTDSEALNIYDKCLDLTSEENRPKSFNMPDSLLPKGGYPAVVEAFARTYVLHYPKGNDEALEHFKSGIAIFALSAPDWTIKAESAMLKRDGSFESGVLKAQSFASDLQSRIVETQMNWGSLAFTERVEELSKSRTNQAIRSSAS